MDVDLLKETHALIRVGQGDISMENQSTLTGSQSPNLRSRPSHSRLQKRRHPLDESTRWANNHARRPESTTQAAAAASTALAQKFPHHTSLTANKVLQSLHEPLSVPTANAKAEDKRVSAISSEDARNSNRDSQLSTTSTNASGQGRKKTYVGPWRLGTTLGTGATGRVRKVKHKTTGQYAAVKIISKRSADLFKSSSMATMDIMMEGPSAGQKEKTLPFGIERECAIMKLIDHPNIIKLYDTWENKGELYLVLEYVEGPELFHHISQHGVLPEYEAVRIFRQVIAGLSYCHKFLICHRDLKPENILLDRYGNVKIVDFGMAALQPINQWLETSCGSPHYACPEVIQGLPYRGDLADAWSCGVVLFAMLAGTLPFYSFSTDVRENVSEVIRAVINCDYEFPPEVSDEAADLIERCLQPRPDVRIKLDDMWKHLLLRRYRHLDPLDPEGKPYVGPAPRPLAKDCGQGFSCPEEIDPLFLRNLQNLWHNVPEAELIERLLSIEPNHEKLLYYKLQKYQEQLCGDYDGPLIEYSTSDHHHASSSQNLLEPPAIGSEMKHPSRFSLAEPVTQQARKTSHSQSNAKRRVSNATQATERSYDPYRPSRTQITQTNKSPEQARVTVLRQASYASSRRPSSRLNNRLSVRNPSIIRAQEGSPKGSPNSIRPMTRCSGQYASSRVSSAQRQFSRANSRATILSRRSGTSTTSMVVHKPGKRGVSFRHQLRHTSGPQTLRRSSNRQLSPYTLHQKYLEGEAEREQQQHEVEAEKPLPQRPPAHSSFRDGSPSNHEQTVPWRRSPKKKPTLFHPDTGNPMSQDVSDTRKVSTELALLCDESWNRGSITSNAPTTATPRTDMRDSQQSYVTKATSISADDHSSIFNLPSTSRTERCSDRERTGGKHTPYIQKALESTSSIYLSADTQREIAKTRDLLRARAMESNSTIGQFDEIIAHLDKLMQPSSIRLADEQRRAISTPEPTFPRKNTFDRIMQKREAEVRAASDPMNRQKPLPTIRIVEDDYKAISPVKPLTIRKKSNSSGSSESQTPTQVHCPPLLSTAQAAKLRAAGLATHDNEALDPIDEDKENFDPLERSRASNKKRNWFRRHAAGPPSRNTDIAPPPLLPKEALRPQVHQEVVAPTAEPQPPKLKKKKSIFNILTNKSQHFKDTSGDYKIDDAASEITESSVMGGRRPLTRRGQTTTTRQSSNASSNETQIHAAPALASSRSRRHPHATHQNWLARILHLKPATHTLYLHLPRVRARKLITSILRSFRPYGLRDIVVDKSTCTITARVDKINSLGIAPVEFCAEVFGVLFQGQRAGLSVVRMRQVRGSKGSFLRVSRAVENVCGGEGIAGAEQERGRRAETRRACPPGEMERGQRVERGVLIMDEKMREEIRWGVGM